MKKKEFLDLLRYYLRNLPSNIINDIISDYEEHFECGLQAGRSEEEIVKELGEPEKIANEYFDYDMFGGQKRTKSKQEKFIKNNKTNSKIAKIILIALLVIIFSGPILGFGVGGLGLLFALFVTGAALIVSGILLPVKLLFGLGPVVFPFELNTITLIFFCIFLISLGIGFIYGIYLIYKIVKNIVKNLQITHRWKNYRNDIGGNENEK